MRTTPLKILTEERARKAYSDPRFKEAVNLALDGKKGAWLSIEEIKIVLRSVYFYDVELFAKDVCVRWTRDKRSKRRIKTPQFHKDMWNDDEGNSLYIVPRDHAKTTARSKIKVLHSKLYRYEPATLIISSEGLGEEIVGDIRFELETNGFLIWLYGNQVPTLESDRAQNQKWRQKHLQLLNGMEIETISKGGALRGKRPTEIIVDDPQEDKDVKNPRIAQEYWEWFWTSVANLLDDGGRICVLGTVIAANCFVNQLKQEAEGRGFKVIEYPAILNFNEEKWTGTPLWPEKWSMQALRKRYNMIKRLPFLQEYMNIPYIKNGSPVFLDEERANLVVLHPIEERNGVKYFRPLAGETGYMGLDLANGRVGGDYTVLKVRNEKGELLCEYRGWIAQDLLPHIVDQVVQELKEVFIVPESNMALAFLIACKPFDWYSYIYRQQALDKITNKESEILGWNTNEKTKLLMITGLKEYMRAGPYEVSEVDKEEIDHYYHDEKGGMNAISPYHDDTVIADALSIQGIKHGVTSPGLIII